MVLDGTRLEDFDVETSAKRQLKGNIYLAKVVRVEPSLQAAFVEYGGNRHGFLAFGEIHPDYYQIPVADRQRRSSRKPRRPAARRRRTTAPRRFGSRPAPPRPSRPKPRRIESRSRKFGAPEHGSGVGRVSVAQPADIAGEPVAATVEAVEPVAEVNAGRGGTMPPIAASRPTFEEVERSGSGGR